MWVFKQIGKKYFREYVKLKETNKTKKNGTNNILLFTVVILSIYFVCRYA